MALFIKIFKIVFIIIIIIFIFFYILKSYHKRNIKQNLNLIDKHTISNQNFYVDFNNIKNLPYPVQKYFKNVLKNGQPYIKKAFLTQSGKLTTSPETKEWISFKADQNISALKPAFLWNAKISIAPLMHIRVIDSYINGKAESNVLLMSSIKVGGEKENSKLDSGALFRYLAEAVWYPTALLPGNGVTWTHVDKNRSIANIRDSENTVSLEFTFNEKGEIIKIYTTDRYGLFNGKYQKCPWEGNFSNYIEVNGIRIPQQGKVGWHLPGGFWLFWQGEINNIHYSFK